MKREALYHADTNELEELPQMEKREHPKGSDFHEWAEYVKYTNHVTALRRLLCSPQPGFKDGEIYVEGVDYEVKKHCEHKDNCLLSAACISCDDKAFPIAPVKSEDETKLWDSAIDLYHRHMHTGHVNAIAEVKSKYIITKR